MRSRRNVIYLLIIFCSCHSTTLFAATRSQRNDSNYNIAWVGLALGTVSIAVEMDEKVKSEFQHNGNLHSNDVAQFGNRWGQMPGGLIALGLFSVGLAAHDKEMRYTGNMMIQSMALSALAARAIKVSSGRLRPYQTSDEEQWDRGGSSFPSGHTTQAFALSTAFAESVPHPSWQRRVLAYGAATSTAYARKYDNKHWFSDTLAGALVGIGVSLATIKLNAAYPDWYLSVIPDFKNGINVGIKRDF